MTAALALPDLRLVHEELGFEEARRARALVGAVAGFEAAADKAAFVAEIRPRLEALGVRGVSLPSMYRKAALLRAGGWRALVDGRVAHRVTGPGGRAGNREFREWWSALALSNRRKTAPAWREMLRRLRMGESLPGLGDWRDIWAADHGGVRPPAGMPCPYHAGGLVPKGLAYRNMMRMLPSKFAVTAARKGMMAAQMAYVPDVPRTRVGLAPCQVVQIDDMWHEVKVAWEGNQRAQRVLDLSMVDVLTGCTVGWLCFPIRERDDGTRETLRSEWMRYHFAHLLCDIGIPDAGCLIMGEHGSATAGADLVRALSEVSGGRVRFGAGGILSTPLGKGLYGGRPKGNPRYKSLIEGFHALIKNELGAARGHVGGGRGAEPEDAYGMDLEDNRLRRIASALEASRPGILDRLALPYMPWSDYWELARAAYDDADRRTWHNLEGWRECGFEAGEWRPTPDSPWLPFSSLKRMDGKAAAAFQSVVVSDPKLFRMRRMSPREAFASRAGELKRLDGVAATVIMGEALARPCRCDDRLQLHYRDDTTLRRLTVAGILDGGVPLERGRVYQVWHNPMNGGVAYVATEDGRFLGTAPVMLAARHDDQGSIERSLGIRQRAIAAESRQLAPYVRQRQAEAAEAARRNAAEILGEDPALELRRRSPAPRQTMGSARPADVAELAFASVRDNDDFTGEDDDGAGVAALLAGITSK